MACIVLWCHNSLSHMQWMYIVIGVFIVMTLNGAGQAAGGGGAS